MWIEIFKSGEHKDSSGRLRKFTDEMLDKIVSLYNGKIKESSSYEAPLVKGHPKTEDPAYGWIEKLKRKGSLLLAKLKDVSSDLVDEVRKGLFKKISIALYPDMMLRHVGLLGATPPAVKGLKPVEFDEDNGFNELTVDNSQLTSEEGLDEENGEFVNQRMLELEEENKNLKSRIEELEGGIRIAEYREFVNSLIECEDGGILTPAQGEELLDILIEADKGDLKFSEGEKSLPERIESLFRSMKPRVDGALFSEYSKGKFEGTKDFSEKVNVNQERLELHRRAREIQACNNELDYEQAVLKARERGLF
jgi:hypothetical protein